MRELQERLNTILSLKLDVDGAFGPKTEEALKQFQRKNGLPDTGIYDEQTHTALTGEEGKSDYSTRHSVNVRTGDGTTYEKIPNLPKNTPLDVVLDGAQKPVISANGWYAVYIMDKIGCSAGIMSRRAPDNAFDVISV